MFWGETLFLGAVFHPLLLDTTSFPECSMIRSLVICLNVIALAVPVMAQRRPGNGNRLPAVGTPLPDVKAFDAAGDEFSTASLRGHYSVLVFGCLT